MSVLERQRYALEDLDRLEGAIADRFLSAPRSHRERISRDHEVAQFLDRVQQQSQLVLDYVADNDALRAHEVEVVHGTANTTAFDEFYKRIRSIRDFHRRHPDEKVENLEESYRKRRRVDDDGVIIADPVDSMFTSEEALGQYMDLIAFHERYLNLKNIKRVPYAQYLDIFFTFDQIAKTSKDDDYLRYLTDLAGYLQSFLERTQPLDDPEGISSKIASDAAAKWGEITTKLQAENGASGNPLYCKACDRTFEKQTVYDGHLNGKKHKKNAELLLSKDASNAEDIATPASAHNKQRSIFITEYTVTSLTKLLDKERAGTKTNVERRSTLTLRERQLELEALEREELGDGTSGGAGGANDDDDAADGKAGSGDDDDEKVYNPLKLPIGWDGKPIPFWLWKLHGLGVEYTCEICGNFVYMGRKAFDKHFGEARHMHGLRCLGIQNSALFREITSIQDALTLWDKIKRERRAQESVREQAVEVEDDEGNVMSEKVYNDLKKQGLI
ncbi:uncharacterized protein V1518DRAFT_418821 [Limtongia smithiae]|uniref:uncharacterized protein n=1 Tax=Limtongia smithiae TaxID=1125753 RepID=UPI0034CE98ED